VQWCRILPLPPSVCGLDCMNFFYLNRRNFQLAYKGMPLSLRTGKKRSMCWRSKRGDPLDNTGLILNRPKLFQISLSLSLVQSISQTTFPPLEQSHYSTGYSSHSTTNILSSAHCHTIQPRFYLNCSKHRAVNSLEL